MTTDVDIPEGYERVDIPEGYEIAQPSENHVKIPEGYEIVPDSALDYEKFKQNYHPSSFGEDVLNVAKGIPEGIYEAGKTIYEGGKEFGQNALEKPAETGARLLPTLAGGVARAEKGIIGLGALALHNTPSYLADKLGLSSDPMLDAYNRQKYAQKVQDISNQEQVFGEMPKAAEALSFAPLPGIGGVAVGAETSAAKALARKAIYDAAAKGAGIAEKTADIGSKAAFFPFNLAGKITDKISNLRDVPVVGQTGANIASKGMAFMAGASFLPKTTAALTTIGGGLKGISEASDLLENVLKKGATPSQLSALEQVSRDATVSPITRRLAQWASGKTIQPILKTSADFAKGSIVGGGIGLGTGVLSGQSGEDLGKSIGAGGVAGGLGYIAGKRLSSDKRFQIAQDSDRNAFIERHSTDPQFSHVDLKGIDKNTLQQATDAELLGSGQYQVRFADNNTYNNLTSGGQAAYQVDPVTGERKIILNLDKIKDGSQTIGHEIGHAIYNSPAIDKSGFNSLMNVLYGQDKIADFRNQYAKKLLGGNPSEAEIQSKIQELDKSLGKDWINNELFSEHFVDQTANQGFLTTPKTGMFLAAKDWLQNTSLAAKKQILEKLGVTSFKEDGSGQFASPNKVFDSPLTRDPNVKKLVQSYINDFSEYRKGLFKAQKPKDQAFPVSYQDAIKLPAFEGILYNIDNKGVKTLNSAKQIVQQQKDILNFGKQVASEAPIKRAGDYKTFGKDQNGYVSGYNGLVDALKKNPNTPTPLLNNAQVFSDAIPNGNVVSGIYVKKMKFINGVPIPEIQYRNVAPVDISLTHPRGGLTGNMYVMGIDIDHLNNHLSKLQIGDKLKLWNNNLNEFWNDYKKLNEAHFQNKEGQSVLTNKKYQFIRETIGFPPDGVPKAGVEPPKGGFWHTYILNNFALPKNVGDANMGFDYYKMKENFLPDIANPK